MITIEFLPNVRVVLEHIQMCEFFEATEISKGYVQLTLSSGKSVILKDYNFKKMEEVVSKRLQQIQIQSNLKHMQS